MIGESLNFMIIGMTVVFLFLIIMVFVLQIQGLIISKYIGNELEDEAIQETDTSSGPVDAKKVAIISAAVKQHIKESK